MTTPDTSRYIYIGVVVIVLAICELLRGRSFAPRVLAAAAAVAALGVLLGGNDLRNGSQFLRSTSYIVRAELGAVELLGERAGKDLRVDAKLAPTLRAGPYLAAVRDVGDSPANSPAEIASTTGEARFFADTLLITGGALERSAAAADAALASTAPSVDGGGALAATDAGCVRTASGALDLTVPATGLLVRPSRAEVAISARRFGDGFQNPENAIAPLAVGGALAVRVAPDASTAPWHLRLESSTGVTACALAP